MRVDQAIVFTIGHSTHSMELFLSLLRKHDVTALADVRSKPYSRFNPQFNREDLEKSLAASDIKYVFLGHELGGRSDDPACYEDGRIVYSRLANTTTFASGIERVILGAQDYRIALMCAEKEPLECHRTLLVADALVKRGIDVQHILANGTLESHDRTIERLLRLFQLQLDLFRTEEDVIADALSRQEKKIAFVVDKPQSSPTEEGL